MKELTYVKKIQVIKWFLEGLSYDDIAHKAGIAKGSVVNIIDEFKEGDLSIPPGMVEITDELRRLVVDLKKNTASVAEVKSCLTLHTRLKELGATIEQAGQWLDACHNLATPTVSANRLVKAAVELANLSSSTGLTYEEFSNTYQRKAQHLKQLDKEIEQAENKIKEIKLECQKEKGQFTGELDSIAKAIATAQDVFERQKNYLKSRLDDYLASNKLEWEKVNTVVALLDKNLGKSGLAKREIDGLARRIRNTGSLANLIKQLTPEKGKLQDEVNELRHKEQIYTNHVNELTNIENSLERSISENTRKLSQLNTEVKSKMAKISELEKTTNRYTDNLYMSRLIIDFLFAPGDLSDYDMDRLVSLMVGLRQSRLGVGPRQVKDANGKVVCECQVPRVSSTVSLSEKGIDDVRTVFAQLLAPLVKDKFVSKHDHEMAKIQFEIDKIRVITEATITERKKHLI